MQKPRRVGDSRKGICTSDYREETTNEMKLPAGVTSQTPFCLGRRG